MPTNILMPALSPTMEKGNLAKWLKKEGDKVAPGDVLAEIETDKATMEVEAVDEGTLAKIVVPEGTQDVPVNQVIAVLAGEGEDVKAAASAAAAARAENCPPKRPPSRRSLSPQRQRPAGRPAQGKPPRAAARNGADGASAAAPPQGRPNLRFAARASGLPRKANIDLARVQGSGPHGRVVARDVEAAKSRRGLKAPAAAARRAARASRRRTSKIMALFEQGSYEVIPHDNMRQDHRPASGRGQATIPHFYLTVDCDHRRACWRRARRSTPPRRKDKEGKPACKVSVNDFVIKALALALQRVPDANVTWTEAGMLKHKHADVGVAVSIPGGLITPIVRHAELKTLSVISNEMKDLAAPRARQETEAGGISRAAPRRFPISACTASRNFPPSSIRRMRRSWRSARARSGPSCATARSRLPR